MINVISHPIISHNLTIMRNTNTSTDAFRAASKNIARFLAIEATKDLKLKTLNIETPLEETPCEHIDEKIVLLPVLRAGLALLEGFREIIPDTSTAFIGMARNEITFEAEETYNSIKILRKDTKIFILEVMIATGGSVCNSIDKLLLDGYSNISVISVLAAPEGLENIISKYPEISIVTCSIERELNQRKYILPGLGDAGDRWCG